MPLTYLQKDVKPRDAIKEGDYDFYVDEARELTFGSGNRGLEVTLRVAVSKDREITVYDQFPYPGRVLVKLEQFLTNIGLRFDPPPDGQDLIGRRGRASFVYDGNGHFAPEVYLPVPAENAGKGRAAPRAYRINSAGYSYGPPLTEEDVPF